MKLRIKITKEVLNATSMCGVDSTNGSYSKNCAITYACRKLFPKSLTASSGIYMIYRDETIIIAILPKIAEDFIARFDKATPTQRVQMKPFEFEIKLTKEVLDSITIDEITEVLETSTTLEAV